MARTIKEVRIGNDEYKIIEFNLRDDMEHDTYVEWGLYKNGDPLRTTSRKNVDVAFELGVIVGEAKKKKE